MGFSRQEYWSGLPFPSPVGSTDAEAEAPILWPSDAKSWLIGKDPNVRKDWRLEEKGTTEDEMVGWHHRLNGHEFEQAPGVGDGQGSLACCSPWGRKESDMTEWLNWTELLKILSPVAIPSLSPFLNFYSLFRSQFEYNFLLEAFSDPPSLN